MANTENPKIAVLLPAYNAENYIAASLESLIRQTYPHWEAFVIDDGSTDKTGDIIQSYAQKETRIRSIRNPQNLRLIQTLNRGLDLICQEKSFDYIARMDADDTCAPTRFARQIDFMRENPELAFCSTAMNFTGTRKGRIVFPQSPLAVRYAAYGCVAPIGHASALFKTDVFMNPAHRYDAGW